MCRRMASHEYEAHIRPTLLILVIWAWSNITVAYAGCLKGHRSHIGRRIELGTDGRWLIHADDMMRGYTGEMAANRVWVRSLDHFRIYTYVYPSNSSLELGR